VKIKIKKAGKAMKGTVVSTWIQTSQNIWGKELTEQAMKRVGWEPERIFSPTEDVEDAKPKAFVAELSASTGKTQDEIWMTIGQDNIQTFFRTYPAFFKRKIYILFSVPCLMFMSS